jgi:ribosomal protein S18 acetylase RimI-like enzyme
MTKQIPPAMRAAQPRDFDFCQRLYFENMSGIIDALNLDVTRQHASFARQWQVAEVRIITVADEGVGWIQVAAGDDDTIFLKQLYLAKRFQRQQIGSRIMEVLIEEAGPKAITLGVVKINPALRLYERLGFRTTHEDQYKFYMRREPD